MRINGNIIMEIDRKCKRAVRFPAIIADRYVSNKKLIPKAIATPTPKLKQIGVGIAIAFEKTSMDPIGFAKNYLADELNHGPVAMNDIQPELLPGSRGYRACPQH